jgi:hypothetical protein
MIPSVIGNSEDRNAELTQLRMDLGDAGKFLGVNIVKDGNNTRYFVAISGNIGDFMRLSESAHDFANLVSNPKVIEYELTNKDLTEQGGAQTCSPGECGNSNVRVQVNPREVLERNFGLSNALEAWNFGGQMNHPAWKIRSMTTSIADWHEFGHGWGKIHGRAGNGSNKESMAWENRMRQQTYGPLGPDNAPRAKHPEVRE